MKDVLELFGRNKLISAVSADSRAVEGRVAAEQDQRVAVLGDLPGVQLLLQIVEQRRQESVVPGVSVAFAQLEEDHHIRGRTGGILQQELLRVAFHQLDTFQLAPDSMIHKTSFVISAIFCHFFCFFKVKIC